MLLKNKHAYKNLMKKGKHKELFITKEIDKLIEEATNVITHQHKYKNLHELNSINEKIKNRIIFLKTINSSSDIPLKI